MSLRKGLFGILGIVLVGGAVVFAQEPQTPAGQDDTLRKERLERWERRRERIGRREGMQPDGFARHGFGKGHFGRQLNLSDEQKQQTRAIVQRRLESIKSQREELFRLREKRIEGTFTEDDAARAKALRQEIHTAMEGTRGEIEAVLTAEQRAQLEQLKNERKQRLEQRMRERQERLNRNPQ